MGETSSHKRAKAKAAGKSGRTEVPLKGKWRLDAVSKVKATGVEQSGTIAGLEKAAKRLKDSRKRQKVLQVPQKDMDKASQAMRDVGSWWNCQEPVRNETTLCPQEEVEFPSHELYCTVRRYTFR